MWEGITSAISNIFGAVRSWIDWRSKKEDLANQADMKARAEAQDAAKRDDEVNKALADGNLEQLRKDAAE